MEVSHLGWVIAVLIGGYIVIKGYQRSTIEGFVSIGKTDYADVEKKTASALLKAKGTINMSNTRENLENIIDNMKELSTIGILYELITFAKGTMDTDAIKKAGDTITSLEKISAATESSLQYLDTQQ